MKQEKVNLKDLQKELPYKWRVQSARYGKASCVAYIDARDAQDLLDDVIGPGNWATEYYEACGLLMCKVGIFVDGHWVWKSDTGSESNVEKNKGHASDAFKRACVSWGIGRFLYRLDIQQIPTKEYKGKEYPYAKEKDKIIFDGTVLTNYINWKVKNDK
tara:strand:+ start:5700 stop:6176 length:477 start_codon:yes stop_codon:yes gene_type:complete